MTTLSQDAAGSSDYVIDELSAREFAAIVGSKFAITEQAEIARYIEEERKLFKGRCNLVLKPNTTEQVARICALANARNIMQGCRQQLPPYSAAYWHVLPASPTRRNLPGSGGQVLERRELVFQMDEEAVRQIWQPLCLRAG